MSNIYVNWATGNDANSGATWALAKAKLSGAAAIDAAGDHIFVSQNSTETTAGTVDLIFAGTQTAPTTIVCGDDSAEPPTALSTFGEVTASGANNLQVRGCLNCYGITFTAGFRLNLCENGQNWQLYEQCCFRLGNSGASDRMNVVDNATTRCEWRDCTVKFSNAAQGMYMPSAGKFIWSGGSVVAGGSTPGTLLTLSAHGTDALIENVDFSNFGTGFNLFGFSTLSVRAVMRNCKLPSGWVGNVAAATIDNPDIRFELWNVGTGNTNYKLSIADYAGTIVDETTLVRTGGASDGVTPIAWKMVSNANAVYPVGVLASPEMYIRNSAVGSAATVTVHILRDSLTNLKNNEVWLEVQYLGTSTTTQGARKSSMVDMLTTAADLSASAETWTTTGMTNPNKQKVSVTFTPQKAGYFICRLLIGKASAGSIYVDPSPVVS